MFRRLSDCAINGFFRGPARSAGASETTIVALVLISIPLGGMFFGREANVTKDVQDKTLCDAGREGMDW
jgi:hypothetical protein